MAALLFRLSGSAVPQTVSGSLQPLGVPACQVLLIPASCEGVPDIECDLQPAPDDANRLRAPRRHPAEGEWHPPTLLLTKC